MEDLRNKLIKITLSTLISKDHVVFNTALDVFCKIIEKKATCSDNISSAIDALVKFLNRDKSDLLVHSGYLIIEKICSTIDQVHLYKEITSILVHVEVSKPFFNTILIINFKKYPIITAQ